MGHIVDPFLHVGWVKNLNLCILGGIYVGPQIGMNDPILVWGLPDLEYWHIPTHTDMGIPIPIWGPHFECLFNLGISSVGPQIGMNPILVWVSDWTIPSPIRGSPFWYGDVLIPISVRGSPNQNGDPQTKIPILIWGLPISVWVGICQYSKSWSPHTNMGFIPIWGPTFILVQSAIHPIVRPAQ